MYRPVSPIYCFPCTVTAAGVGGGDGVFEMAQVVFIGDSWLERHLYVIWAQNPSNPLRASMLIHVYKVGQFWVHCWESIRAQVAYSIGECGWQCSSEHTWDPGRVINWDSCTILDKENHSRKRKCLESFYICQRRPSLNRDKGTRPNTYTTLLYSRKRIYLLGHVCVHLSYCCALYFTCHFIDDELSSA